MIGLVTTVAALLAFAKVMARDRSNEDRDEIDVAAILENRHLRMRSRPFIGGTVLVVAGQVELDLRRTTPAPTGVELAVLVVCGVLRLVVPPDWRPEISVDTRAARLDSFLTDSNTDGPLFRLTGRALLSRVEVVPRAVPTAAAS